MPDDDDYSPFSDLNTFHEVGLGTDYPTFFEPVSNNCSYCGIPPLTDVLNVGCRIYTNVEDPEVRESLLEVAAAQFGMSRSALKRLICIWS